MQEVKVRFTEYESTLYFDYEGKTYLYAGHGENVMHGVMIGNHSYWKAVVEHALARNYTRALEMARLHDMRVMAFDLTYLKVVVDNDQLANPIPEIADLPSVAMELIPVKMFTEDDVEFMECQGVSYLYLGKDEENIYGVCRQLSKFDHTQLETAIGYGGLPLALSTARKRMHFIWSAPLCDVDIQPAAPAVEEQPKPVFAAIFKDPAGRLIMHLDGIKHLYLGVEDTQLVSVVFDEDDQFFREKILPAYWNDRYRGVMGVLIGCQAMDRLVKTESEGLTLGGSMAGVARIRLNQAINERAAVQLNAIVDLLETLPELDMSSVQVSNAFYRLMEVPLIQQAVNVFRPRNPDLSRAYENVSITPVKEFVELDTSKMPEGSSYSTPDGKRYTKINGQVVPDGDVFTRSRLTVREPFRR